MYSIEDMRNEGIIFLFLSFIFATISLAAWSFFDSFVCMATATNHPAIVMELLLYLVMLLTSVAAGLCFVVSLTAIWQLVMTIIKGVG